MTRQNKMFNSEIPILRYTEGRNVQFWNVLIKSTPRSPMTVITRPRETHDMTTATALASAVKTDALSSNPTPDTNRFSKTVVPILQPSPKPSVQIWTKPHVHKKNPKNPLQKARENRMIHQNLKYLCPPSLIDTFTEDPPPPVLYGISSKYPVLLRHEFYTEC